MNRAILIGRLTRDPEVRYTQSNRAVASFTLAINRPFTNQDGTKEADFINVIAWDKIGENAGKYLHKGSQAAVEGRIQTRNYENDEGKKVYVTEIVANNIQFLDSKSDDSKFTSMPEPPQQGVQQTTIEQHGQDPFEQFGQQIEETSISENDFPF